MIVTPPAHLLFLYFVWVYGSLISGFIVSISRSAAFPYNTVTMHGTSGKFLILYSVI